MPDVKTDESQPEPVSHRASERGGWALRLYYTGSGVVVREVESSSLNCFSLGDVVAYDTEADATRAAALAFEASAPYGLYTKITVERVEQGAWAPSIIDALFLKALVYVERAADGGDHEARHLGNGIRARLSSYAPESVRAPR